MTRLYHLFAGVMGLKSMKFAAPIAAALQVDLQRVLAKRVMTGTSGLSGSGTVKKLGTAAPSIGWFIGTIAGAAANCGCV
jgi:hypothetical protein